MADSKQYKRTAIWFNDHVKDGHDKLIEAGVTSQPFAEFVKRAYHEAREKLVAQYQGGKNASI